MTPLLCFPPHHPIAVTTKESPKSHKKKSSHTPNNHFTEVAAEAQSDCDLARVTQLVSGQV